MAEHQDEYQIRQGLKEVSLALDPDTEFRTLVDVLEKALTLPDILDIRGCSPCNSGLDRIVIESSMLRRLR